MPSMWGRSQVLSVLEIVCAVVFTVGVSAAGYGLAGVAGAVASGLITAGATGFYLVNSYAMGEGEEPDDQP